MEEDYERLRVELEAAYRAAVWDSASIDRITARMADVELALASHEWRASKSSSVGARHEHG